MTDDDRRWQEDAEHNGWQLPKRAASWKRLPLIRHVRVFVLAWKVERHYGVWRSMGALPSGYDHWVLYAIARGWC